MKLPLRPLKFEPILKEKIWGGKKLMEHFGKEATGIIGESWELSGVAGNASIVLNGICKGKNITQLIEDYGSQLLGTRIYKEFGNTFPLLFKYIDAAQDLSVQVHPDDTLAKERHDSFGKTEMWYIMQAEEKARLITGFKKGITPEDYQQKLQQNAITEILKEEPVKAGDSFFIAPGTVHAIGAGVVLAEIQQTSDITYRIYDWERLGVDGKMRELHTKEAIAAIDYKQPEAKLSYISEKNKATFLKSTPYFETNRILISEKMERDYSQLDSFVVYMCVAGEAVVEVDDISEKIKTGETLLLPAVIDKVVVTSHNAILLEVYIP